MNLWAWKLNADTFNKILPKEDKKQWAMKQFRHILMGHEIFFKIFDGPQNIF